MNAHSTADLEVGATRSRLRNGEGAEAVGGKEAGGSSGGGGLLAERVADEESDRGVGVIARVVGGEVGAGEPVRPGSGRRPALWKS